MAGTWPALGHGRRRVRDAAGRRDDPVPRDRARHRRRTAAPRAGRRDVPLRPPGELAGGLLLRTDPRLPERGHRRAAGAGGCRTGACYDHQGPDPAPARDPGRTNMSAETHRGTSPAPGTGDAADQAQGEPGTGAEGFFRVEGDTLVPAAFATSPWGQVLHGRLIGGLTARAAEQARAGVPELACGRLTVDLFRSVPLAPVGVSARTVRQGRRIVVLDVTVEQDGAPVGQGRAVLLRRSEQPDGTFRPVPAWDAPAPPRLGPPQSTVSSRWTAPWESWPVGGAADGPGGVL